ncbi:hypothetical protein AY601_4866 [Pedobacter cryoconitis]|uniref:DUF5683 domain-containing protein n=1 Tax=Pedobacter cryoconitis TaxID=188932 RepID=A0A127VK52_9SPHI|nr:DUF5683 domain-containing protein [Pedobacter cryoconitis]AMQ01687.1 hypothetical protein AY601_4866 [Pedobacter cryoconitis]
MPKNLLLSVLFCCTVFAVSGQEKFSVKGDSLKRTPVKADTGYVNLGRIAGRKAAIRSALIPGWGQYGNGLTVYRGIKIAAIYTGGTLLAISFIQNNNKYHEYLTELQFRAANNDQPTQGSPLANISTAGLITAKDVYRRNKEVIIFSFAGLYVVNIVEAYVDARLSYFDIGDNLAIKISPTVIGTQSLMYGYNAFNPGLKVAFRF